MENNDELKEIDIENRPCYYFDDIMRARDFDFGNILLDEKSYENLHENILKTKNIFGCKTIAY